LGFASGTAYRGALCLPPAMLISSLRVDGNVDKPTLCSKTILIRWASGLIARLSQTNPGNNPRREKLPWKYLLPDAPFVLGRGAYA
jgi:hypothetical protein